MALMFPALDPRDVEPKTGSGYPPEYKARVLPRQRRALGDALGLTKIGVNLTTLEPGKESSMRHWHTQEDEFIYVVSGEVVLRTNGGEQVLSAGQCAGFKAGVADGHQLFNRTSTTAVYLAISNRDGSDAAYYPDVDMQMHPEGAPHTFTRKDGTPF